MTNTPGNIMTLATLIEAAFDSAGIITADPNVVARIAAGAVARRLARAHRFDIARQLESRPGGRRRRRSAATVAHARAA